MASPPKRFAPPPTRGGQIPGTLPPTPAVQPRARQATPPPPPTRFGPAMAATPRVGQAKPASGAPMPAIRPAAAPPRPPVAMPRRSAPPGSPVAVQRFSMIGGLIGAGLNWVGDRVGDYLFGDLGRAAAEGMAEGMESLDEYLYSREGDYQNLEAHKFNREMTTWNMLAPDEPADAIVCYQDDPQDFTRRVKSGERFIWAASTDGRLFVGRMIKGLYHAILAGGRNVHGAGEGQLRSGNTVVLDFESGHYQPKSGWRPSMNAWSSAGFFAVVDRNARNH